MREVERKKGKRGDKEQSPAVEPAASIHHGGIVPTLTLTPIQRLPSSRIRTDLVHPCLQDTRVRKIYYTASTGGSVSVSLLLPLLLLLLWARLGEIPGLGAIERAQKAIGGGSQGRGGLVLLEKRKHKLTLSGLLPL